MNRLYHSDIPEDTMTMLVMGKGPSSREVKHLGDDEIRIGDKTYKKPSRLEITSVNNSWQIIDRVDYAFMIDYFSLELLKEEETKKEAIKKIKRLVIPTYPQVYAQQQGVKVKHLAFPYHPDFHIYAEEYQKIIEGIPYYAFQLDGAPIGYYELDSLSERPAGVSNAAVDFAIARGFRHFILCGFDPLSSLENVYNERFRKKTAELDQQLLALYTFSYAKVIEKIVNCGCSYERLG